MKEKSCWKILKPAAKRKKKNLRKTLFHRLKAKSCWKSETQRLWANKCIFSAVEGVEVDKNVRKIIDFSGWTNLRFEEKRCISYSRLRRFQYFSSKYISFIYIYMYIHQVVISVCLFACLIITQEPLDRFASNFDKGTRENHGNVLSLVLRF